MVGGGASVRFWISPVSMFSTVVLSCLIFRLGAVGAQTLYTSSRWIVDGGGDRVKLACINWPSHLQPMLAEGLHRQPADAIAAKVRSMGFNCVRFTWALYMATNDTLGALTVRQSFRNLGLDDYIAGIQSNNPSIVDVPVLEAFKIVLASLRRNGVMVILDNHISTPGWCCSRGDGNGFFGDKYFDPDLWLRGLHRMATLAIAFDNVVGMSLRNELRGPRENVEDWYKYMERGAETVHAANHKVLVILSGLGFDMDLLFLRDRPVRVSFSRKLVFELHWYSFSDSRDAWVDENLNQVCGRISRQKTRMSGYVLDNGFPLFLSEFGIDERGTNENDNRFLTCFLGWAAENDLDFALWSLQGSYYFRQGVRDMEEFFGVLDRSWTGIRNSTFLQRVSAIQSPFRGPGLQDTNLPVIIFHPLTGQCVVRMTSRSQSLKLGPCMQPQAWIYTPRKKLLLLGTREYLLSGGLGRPVTVGQGNTSSWATISDSGMHIATEVGRAIGCLDVDREMNVVVSGCKCLSGDRACDPSSQWFRLVDSSRCG
ncbi:hypothetical protein MLD38_025484 [Melastoma candidum]|uniref:Uncharacterized protein n=1 Tax=Melastoma candidum TaxID=119954 RepID=A0ACB9NZ09_9MYRT|nr:hypothetical protein MLD38_025484 [Melastoma candidum]